YQQHNSHPLTF
nr:immunoglobulin light chain junction region [Macaca mulatta]MPO00561.1 immunoglobulin light chain junction region [Macaca mulatta]